MGGFLGAGLVKHDIQKVLPKLNVQLQTLTLPVAPPKIPRPWILKTPQNAHEASPQPEHIKSHIYAHQNSSPTSTLAAIDQFAKGAIAIMHEVIESTSPYKRLLLPSICPFIPRSSIFKHDLFHQGLQTASK